MEPKLYSHNIGALVLAFVVTLLLASSMPPAMAAYSGNATYIDYQPEPDWLRDTVNCPSLDSENYQLAFRQRYRWTEFCGDCGPYTGDCGCHRCLQVTNAATDDDASVTVRIIEICNFDPEEDPVIWMDKVAFDQIDTNGQGAALGGQGTAQLKVNYVITDCQDPE